MSTIATRSYPALPPQKIAFIGLGVMGAPMAGHLARAGHRVAVYNRSPQKALDWQAEFSNTVATSPAEAAHTAKFIGLCVGTDDDVRQVVTGPDGILESAQPGAVICDHTTTSATLARELAVLCAAQGVAFLDAPVSGGQAGAQNGQLAVMAGGDAAAFARAQPVLMAYAKAATRIGDSGAGQLTKMVNQICIAGLVQGLAEALAFGQKAGLPMELVLDVIGKGAAQSWQLDNRGKTMLAGQYEFGFAVDWMRKDLGLVFAEAARVHADLPVAQLVDGFYAEVQANGGARWDTSALMTRLVDAK